MEGLAGDHAPLRHLRESCVSDRAAGARATSAVPRTQVFELEQRKAQRAEQAADLLHRTLINIEVYDLKSWRWLCQFQALRRLKVQVLLPPMPPSFWLPRLEKVSLDDSNAIRHKVVVLESAIQLVCSCPALRSLKLNRVRR